MLTHLSYPYIVNAHGRQKETVLQEWSPPQSGQHVPAKERNPRVSRVFTDPRSKPKAGNGSISMMEWRTNRLESDVTNQLQRPITHKIATLPALIRNLIHPQPNGCWLWYGPKFKGTGYGRLWYQAKNWKAHRLVWTLINGPIPPGIDVLHHCDTPLCVNAEKCLFLGTDADNHQDKAAKGRHWQQKKTHCPQGHPYSPENTYHQPAGGRQCCICKGIPPRRIA